MSQIATQIGEMADGLIKFKDEYGSRVSELEKRFARLPSDGFETNGAANDNNPLAAAIAASDEIQNLTSSFRGKAVVKLAGERADITSGNSTVGAGRSQGTSLVPGHRVPGIIEPYIRELKLRDVIGSARTTSNVVEFVRETSFTNNAAPVAETTLKPRSDLGFNMFSAPVRTLAHTFRISRQMLDDAPALAAYIGRRGTYGLKFVEEQQVLNGDGTGQNLLGILPQATAFDPEFTSASETSIDRILQAISQAEDSDIPVNAVVLNKRDWRKITGTKDLGGNYLSENSPFGLTDPRLWNVQIVATNAIAAGTFLAGAFGEGASIFDRLETEVLLSTENSDDFETNRCTIRIESRLAMAVFRPDAFITGALEAA